MTREEVIKALIKERKTALHENKQAFDMAIKALEQESKVKKVIKMRDATPEERESIDKYIKSISTTTGVDIWDLEPSEDAISRQAVLDMATTIQTDDYSGNEIMEVIDVDDIKALPSVTPTQRWIPVSERLPKTDGDYLLFGKVDEDEENYIFVGEYDSCGEQFGIWVEQFDRTTLGCLGSEFYEYASVLAWMSLPEPYKTESEE